MCMTQTHCSFPRDKQENRYGMSNSLSQFLVHKVFFSFFKNLCCFYWVKKMNSCISFCTIFHFSLWLNLALCISPTDHQWSCMLKTCILTETRPCGQRDQTVPEITRFLLLENRKDVPIRVCCLTVNIVSLIRLNVLN